jgi:hypothetical protein
MRPLLILLAGLSLPVAAIAQTSPAAPAPAAVTQEPATAGTPRTGRREHDNLTPEQRAARVEQHLTRLRTALSITPAQVAPWDTFASVTRANSVEMHDRFQQRETQFARMNASENMNDYAAISELHAQQLRRLAVAFQALYGTMSPEQRNAADAVFRMSPRPAATPRR